jgi:acetyltransferase-like isoleucine patch superfamily enzyme
MSHLSETERSIQRRGIFGHYVSGAYRTFARPIFTQWHVARAKSKAFLWGMDEVSHYLYGRSRRDIPALLRAFGANVAGDAIIMERLNIHNANHARYEKLHIGKRALIVNDVYLDLAVGITIEEDVIIGHHTSLLGHSDFGEHHPLRSEFPPELGAVHIQKGAFIGAHSVVLHDVTVGAYAVVAAGSLVRENVPPYTLVAGNPAKVIRQLNENLIAKSEEA